MQPKENKWYMKWCCRCRQLLPLNCFSKDKSKRDGLRSVCKDCERQYRQDNKEKFVKRRKQFYQNNKEKIVECSRRYYQENKEKVVKCKKRYVKKRYQEDPKFRLNHIMSAGIGRSLKVKNISKGGRRWESVVDFTLEELINHLESQFYAGMTWENQGDWHVDHIKPVSLFNFESMEEQGFKDCWGLSNLQPLWAEDNMRKHNRYQYFVEDYWDRRQER